MKNRSKKKNKKTLLIFVLIVILTIGGIVGYSYVFRNKENGYIPKLPNIVKEPKEPERKLQIIDVNSDFRPYAVMINNNSAVWSYQSGLNEAYIVYELLVEGGITREMALFQKYDVNKIQSIRSSRHYFLDYALENDALYVHWGWSPQAESDIKSLGINNINGLTYEGQYFFRDNTVKADYEHKGYITGENIEKAVKSLKYRSTTDQKPLLSYSIDPIKFDGLEGVKDADTVEIKFSTGYTAKFYYNKDTKLYERTQNSTDIYDFTSKERITCKNIITYEVGYSNIQGDGKGRQNLDNIGSGDGYFISEGKAVPIKWEKSSRSARTKYKLQDGSELLVNDGITYIELQPKGQNLNITGNEEVSE